MTFGETITIEGIVSTVTWQKEGNDFKIFTVKAAGQQMKCAGALPFELAEGLYVKLRGEWIDHPTWGAQLKVSRSKIIEPTTKSGIVSFLGSGIFPGVGPVTAKRIVDEFGEETLDVLRRGDMDALLTVPSLRPAIAETLIEHYATNNGKASAYADLYALKLTNRQVEKAFQKWGLSASERITQNPYILVELEGVGFTRWKG